MPEDLPWHLESECSAYTEFMHALISQVGSQVTLRRINRITARFRHPCPFSLLALLYVALTISPFIQVPTMPSYTWAKCAKMQDYLSVQWKVSLWDLTKTEISYSSYFPCYLYVTFQSSEIRTHHGFTFNWSMQYTQCFLCLCHFNDSTSNLAFPYFSIL